MRWGEYGIVRVCPKCNAIGLYKGDAKEDLPHGRESHMTTEVEIGMMWLRAEDSRQLPEARRGKEQVVPYSLQREHSLAEALILAQ